MAEPAAAAPAPAAPFHFSGTTAVDEQLAADIAVAGAFSVPQLVAVASLVLDSMKAPKVTGPGWHAPSHAPPQGPARGGGGVWPTVLV